MTNARAGNRPSNTIDLLGPASETLHYMQAQIQSAEE